AMEMPMSRGTVQSFRDFVDTHLCDLRARFGMATWFLARKHDDRWLALQTVGNKSDLSERDIKTCIADNGIDRLQRDEALSAIYPIIRADSGGIPNATETKVRAHLYLPLFDQHDVLFGGIGAFDSKPQ